MMFIIHSHFQNKLVINIVEVKSNPDDVFKAQKQLEKSEFIFGQIFKSICQHKICIQKIVAIPTHKEPYQLKKVTDANVTVLQFNDNKETDLGIFGTMDREPSSKGCIYWIANNSD